MSVFQGQHVQYQGIHISGSDSVLSLNGRRAVDASEVDLREQDIISVAISVGDVNLIGVVKFYDARRRGCHRLLEKLDSDIDRRVNSLIGSAHAHRRQAHDKYGH